MRAIPTGLTSSRRRSGGAKDVWRMCSFTSEKRVVLLICNGKWLWFVWRIKVNHPQIHIPYQSISSISSSPYYPRLFNVFFEKAPSAAPPKPPSWSPMYRNSQLAGVLWEQSGASGAKSADWKGFPDDVSFGKWAPPIFEILWGCFL